MTVIVATVVSGVVRALHGRQKAQVELARIADEGLTEWVRITGSHGSVQETGRGRTVWAAPPAASGGGDHGEAHRPHRPHRPH
ncbi:hypothetical protein ACIP88_00690 [Streptomyces uncialis]|uniref:hypothetical protein n=1 Tax=Streptomyces uncialis TaxID=1048205 RepID=UPI00382D9036